MASSSENSVITVNVGFTKTIKRSLSVMTMPTAVFSTTASEPQFDQLPRRPSPNAKWRSQIVPEPPTHAEQSADEPMEEGSAKYRRYTNLARLLKRVFNIDIEMCLCCGGQLKIIAAIEGPPVLRKILPHLGLLSYPPRTHLRATTRTAKRISNKDTVKIGTRTRVEGFQWPGSLNRQI